MRKVYFNEFIVLTWNFELPQGPKSYGISIGPKNWAFTVCLYTV